MARPKLARRPPLPRRLGWLAGLVVAASVVIAVGWVARPTVADPVTTTAPSLEPAAVHPTSPPSEPSPDPTFVVAPTLAAESPSPTLDPAWTPEPIAPAPIPSGRVATRVTVAALGIDIPVTRQTTPYPACGVAMYLMELGQPGTGGVTYLYAHAQAGNFLPLYLASLVNNGARMLGMVVQVYTGDSFKFTYRIVAVRRHVTSLDGAFAWRGESVFLQTSEGQGNTATKLQVVAEHVATERAEYEAAHPPPRPVTCR